VIGPLPLAQNVSIAALDKVAPRGVIGLRRERGFARRLLDEMHVRRAHDFVLLTSLSGGNQQKALFGRIFAASPTVAVCEDPTAGVDTEGKDAIHTLLRTLAQPGAVVLSSDDYAEVAGLASRVLVMRDGTVVDELAAPDLTEELITQAVLNGAAA
jgi:ABC-type sugar transport system ATPase subunit